MVFFLLKREEMLKAALGLSLFAPAVLVPVPGKFVAVGFVQFLAFLALVGLARFRQDQRTSQFEVALPIHGRQILLVRTLSALFFVWLPIAMAMTFATRRSDGGMIVEQLAQGGWVLTFAVLLPLSARLNEAALPGRISFFLWGGALSAGAVTWLVVPPILHLACFAALSIATFIHAYLNVPAGFQVSPFELDEERSSPAPTFERPAWWPIWRSAIPWLGLMLFVLGGLLGISLQFVPQYLVLVFQTGLFVRSSTRWLQALPLSHKTLLRVTLATTVVPFAVGMMITVWFRPSFLPISKPTVGFGPRYLDDQGRFFGTNVPLEYWKPVSGARPPVIRAPWGETVYPKPLSILGLRFYNPYASSQANTKPFIEWQFENATQALTGRRIAQSDYYKIRMAERPEPADERVTRILQLSVALFAFLACAFFRELALWHRWKRGTFASGPQLLTIPIFLMVAFLLVDMAYMLRDDTFAFVPLMEMFLRHIANLLPQNLMVISLIALVPTVALYFLLEWQFAQAEMTGPLIPSLQPLGRDSGPR